MSYLKNNSNLCTDSDNELAQLVPFPHLIPGALDVERAE